MATHIFDINYKQNRCYHRHNVSKIEDAVIVLE